MADEVVKVKAGIWTSEWFGTIIVHLLSAVVVYLGTMSGNPWVQVAGSVVGAILSFFKQRTYELGRTEIKLAALSARASALAVAVPKLPPA